MKVLLCLGAVALTFSVSGCAGGADYTASITDLSPADSGQVSVTLTITNTSGSDGQPICTVDLYDNAGTNLGSRTVDYATIKAHETKTSGILVDVKGTQPADSAQSVVTCS